MNISGIIKNNSIKLLSGFANNNDSLAPMVLKDAISNTAIVATYKKEGGKDDAREKAIEEYGTGVVWLFGIPTLKKLFDKAVYGFFKLNPDFDIRTLKDEKYLNNIKDNLLKDPNPALNAQKNVFNSLNDKNAVLKKFTNAQLYKGLFISKFALSTSICAIALAALVKYKQKTTQKRIEKDCYKNMASEVLLNNAVKKSKVFEDFGGVDDKKEPQKDISFKGLGELFMYNPIANNSILDGAIAATRLKEARKGERAEVGMKEAFQIAFIYLLAKPIQMAFEAIGEKFKMPISLDPMVLFSKNIKEKLSQASEIIKENGFVVQSKNAKGNVVNSLKDGGLNKMLELAKENINNPLLDILDKNGAIQIIKDKKGNKQAINYLKRFDEAAIVKTMLDIDKLNKQVDNLKSIKAYKVFAVFANIAIAAWATGVLQPKLAILMRKILHNGDNRNPAIVEQERQMQLKAHQG